MLSFNKWNVLAVAIGLLAGSVQSDVLSYVNACIYVPFSGYTPINVNFTVGGGATSCMRTIGHNNSTRLYKKGLTCVELGVVSAVWPQPDLFCQDNGDIWRVGYNFGGRNGSTLTSWFTPQGGSPIGPASTISLFSSTVDTVICRNETLCNSRLAVVSVSTFRPNLYVIFEPFGTGTTSSTSTHQSTTIRRSTATTRATTTHRSTARPTTTRSTSTRRPQATPSSAQAIKNAAVAAGLAKAEAIANAALTPSGLSSLLNGDFDQPKRPKGPKGPAHYAAHDIDGDDEDDETDNEKDDDWAFGFD